MNPESSITGLVWPSQAVVHIGNGKRSHVEASCYCPNCAPDIFEWVKAHKSHEGYVDARDPAGRLARAWFNGVEVTQICCTALGGSEGFVVLHADPTHSDVRAHCCERCLHVSGMHPVCQRVWAGNVRVAIYPSLEALERSKAVE